MNRTVSSSSVRPDASPPSSGSIGDDSVRKRSTASVGKVTGSASRIAPSAPGQVGHAGQRAGALLELLDRRVERRRAALAEARRPHRHRGAALDLAPVADHATRAAPDQALRRRGSRAPPRAPPRAPRGCFPETNTIASSHGAPSSSTAAADAASSAAIRASGTVDRPVPMRTPMVLLTILRGLMRAGCRGRRRGRAGRARPYWLAVPCAAASCVIAVFGPTGRGEDRGRDRARRATERAGRGPGRGVGRRAAGLRGPADPDRRRERRRAATARAPADRLRRRSTETFSAGAYAERAHDEIDALIAHDRRPIVVGGTGLYLRAALAELDLKPPVDPAIRERAGQRPAAARTSSTRSCPRRSAWASSRPTASASSERTSCSRPATSRRRPRTRPASCGPASTRHPTLLAALTMDRDALDDPHRPTHRRHARGRRASRGTAGRRGRRVESRRGARSGSSSCSTATSRR